MQIQVTYRVQILTAIVPVVENPHLERREDSADTRYQHRIASQRRRAGPDVTRVGRTRPPLRRESVGKRITSGSSVHASTTMPTDQPSRARDGWSRPVTSKGQHLTMVLRAKHPLSLLVYMLMSLKKSLPDSAHHHNQKSQPSSFSPPSLQALPRHTALCFSPAALFR